MKTWRVPDGARKRGLVHHESTGRGTDEVTAIVKVSTTELSCSRSSAAWFCRRHVDLQRVASALCPGS